MANNPYVNKVQFGGATVMDISDTTATASDVASGKYFYTASGEKVQGTASGGNSGGIVITDTQDAAGGTVRTITAVEISGTKQITANGTGIDVTEYAAVDVQVPGDSPTLVTKNITANGTYDAEDDDADGYSSVTVAVPSSEPNLQAKTNVSPSTSSQTITADTGFDALSSVQINAMPSGTAGTPTATKGTVSNHSVSITPSVTNTTGYISGGTKNGTAVTVTASELASGNKEITANGTDIDVIGYSTVSVAVPTASGKAGQFQSKVARTNQTTYTDMGFEITVAKAGTYNIYWTGYRSSTSSGTNGAQIYKNGSSLGNAVTTFDGTLANWQLGSLSNQTLATNDKITIRARARNTSSYMYIANLTIIEA